MVAELDDLAHNELLDLYPTVAKYITLSIHDVAPNILSAYDKKLYEYANQQLLKRKIHVETRSHIEKVERDCIYTKEKGRIGAGMVVWATGNKNVPLVEKLDLQLPEKGLKRILTDTRLRVFKKGTDNEIRDNVFAIGDAADIVDSSLPTTAEVACQKAKYLVRVLNSADSTVSKHEPFKYTQKRLVSYIGARDGVIAGKDDDDEGWTGQGAWLAWRGFNISWNRNWRSRVAIVFTWTLNALFGKEVAKI